MNASDLKIAGNEVAGLAVQSGAVADLLTVARNALADHEAILGDKRANEVILAYTNGLGIAFKDGAPFATSIIRAERIVGRPVGECRNGHGEVAKRMTRGCAVAIYLPTLRRMVADFEGL